MADPTLDEQIASWRQLLEWIEANVPGERAIKSDFPSLRNCRFALATLERHAQVEQELRADCVAACDLASKAAEECGDLRQERDRAQARWHAAVEMGMDVERERDAARAELADLQRTFDLQWKADQRAIKQWQEAHPGNDMVWPDRCNMVVWLLDQLVAATAVLDDEEAGALESVDYIVRLRAELAEAKTEIERLRGGFADINKALLNSAEIEKRAYLQGAADMKEKLRQRHERAMAVVDAARAYIDAGFHTPTIVNAITDMDTALAAFDAAETEGDEGP